MQLPDSAGVVYVSTGHSMATSSAQWVSGRPQAPRSVRTPFCVPHDQHASLSCCSGKLSYEIHGLLSVCPAFAMITVDFAEAQCVLPEAFTVSIDGLCSDLCKCTCHDEMVHVHQD